MTPYRKFIAILVFFVIGSLVQAAHLSPEKEREVKAAVAGLLPGEREVKHIDIYPHPTRNGIYAVLLDDNWWFKSLRIAEIKNGALVWSAEIPADTEWGDNSILSAAWHEMPKIGITILEVYTSTHKGNGEYIVFELRGQKLERLMAVRSIGNLGADYGDTDVRIDRQGKVRKGTSFEEIEVEGRAKYQQGNPPKVMKSEQLYQLFQWNPEKKVFEEYLPKRKGNLRFLGI